MFARIVHGWDRVEQILIGALGAIALLVGMVQVIGRYIAPSQAIGSAEEIIVYLVIWAIMIASSQLVRTDGHVRPDIVLRLLPPGAQRWLELFNCLVALIFCAGMVWYGADIVGTSWMLDETSSTDLSFPMWLYYLALPAGGGLMFIRYLIRAVRYAWYFDAKTMAIGHTLSEEHSVDSRIP